jgi:hypothetical protein
MPVAGVTIAQHWLLFKDHIGNKKQINSAMFLVNEQIVNAIQKQIPHRNYDDEWYEDELGKLVNKQGSWNAVTAVQLDIYTSFEFGNLYT